MNPGVKRIIEGLRQNEGKSEGPAILALEDGTVFQGRFFGYPGEAEGEVVFNTSMTGYQEVLTDPSYQGQIVAMTYPQIGNYGINHVDVESSHPQVEGFIIKELAPLESNYRSEQDLDSYLRKHKITGIQGIDTRCLTRHIRTRGAMKGVLSTRDLDPVRLVKRAKNSPGLVGRDLVKEVTCAGRYEWNEPVADLFSPPAKKPRQKEFKVVVIDCGVKRNILRSLVSRGCRVTVVPARTESKQIMALQPDGVLISNGPGDPQGVPYVIQTARELLGRVPIFGICLGHQILSLALGGNTYKLKFGHRGSNQPVMDLGTRKVEITCQNHGFAVETGSIPDPDVLLTHINLNDQTCEGIRHRKLPVFSVQYHPEASAGPHDAAYLFDNFINLIREERNAPAG